MEWTLAFLCASAFVAGAMNSVAGGGTLLTFPALTAVVSPAVANATSTVALLPGSFAGALGYRRELWDCRRFVFRMLVPSLVGGGFGAWLVVKNQRAFASLVPWLILTAAVLFAIQAPLARWLKRRAATTNAQPGEARGPLQWAVMVFQLLIAIYGGYFGAGIGILMLSALGLMGMGDIHRMNAVKTFLAAIINTATVAVFLSAGDRLVRWDLAWPMVVSSIVGGYCGARVARRLPAHYVRYAVVVIGFSLSAYYFLKEYAKL